MRSFLVFSAGAAGLLLGAPALAQDASASIPPSAQSIAGDLGKDSITIGGGGAYLPDYEGSNDYRLTPAPAAIGSYKGFNFQLIGNRFSVDLIPSPAGPSYDVQFGPLVVVNFNRDSVKHIDDPRVRALGELDTAFELGGFVGVGKTGVITSPYDKLSVSLSYRHDVSNVSDGDVITPSINYLTPLSTKAAVGLFASADHVSRGYARTYFGVTPAQSVASGLPVYYPNDGWKSFTVGALATYSLTGNLLHGFKVVAGGTYTTLMGDVGYSPLVRIAGSSNQWLGAVGLAYTF